MVTPLFMALFTIPKLAILPLILLIFGVRSEMSKYVVIALGAFFLVLINIVAGVVK